MLLLHLQFCNYELVARGFVTPKRKSTPSQQTSLRTWCQTLMLSGRAWVASSSDPFGNPTFIKAVIKTFPSSGGVLDETVQPSVIVQTPVVSPELLAFCTYKV